MLLQNSIGNSLSERRDLERKIREFVRQCQNRKIKEEVIKIPRDFTIR